MQCPVLIHHLPISLRARYAVSGTDGASGAITIRVRYAVSGTDLAYGATSLAVALNLPPLGCAQRARRVR
eukprot:3521671-Rhodomonas_salina.1